MPDVLKNMPLRDPITEYFAFVVFDGKGKEGIPSITLGLDTFPMIHGNRGILEQMRGAAIVLAEHAGLGLKVIRFETIDVLETIVEPSS
jgi:hypothetical protein